MNNELSEERINKDCPHCDPKSFALTNKLEETERFWIVCDVHLLTEGHILIVPKKHISCMGNYPNEYYKEFLEHHKKISSFILKTYGSLAVFEHGKIGQTVYHSHVHYFPYIGNEYKIIPEGEKYLIPIDSLDDLKKIYQKNGRYLYFSLNNKQWCVDVSFGASRFFRDRFAVALGRSERGNWKKMHVHKELMIQAHKEIVFLEKKWFSK